MVCIFLSTQNWLPWQRPLRNWKKWTGSQHSHKYLPFGEKIVKIGPVDPEIALLNLKKKEKEINASKIDSPSGKFAERAK